GQPALAERPNPVRAGPQSRGQTLPLAAVGMAAALSAAGRHRLGSGVPRHGGAAPAELGILCGDVLPVPGVRAARLHLSLRPQTAPRSAPTLRRERLQDAIIAISERTDIFLSVHSSPTA